MIDANNKQFGSAVLKFSNVCKTAWAKMTLGKAAPSGLEANAYVKRNTDGKELSCSSAGGNGKVLPGQTNRWFMFSISVLHMRCGNIIIHQAEPSLMPI
nr:DUF2690 domain-containing protein [Bacillus paralicheniformis]